MTNWVIDKFFGIAPKVSPRRLADGMAVLAENVDTDVEQLAPRHGLTGSYSAIDSNTVSIYDYPPNGPQIANRFQQVVRSFQPDDADNKLYFSDYPNYAKIRTIGVERRLGLPKPDGLTVAAIPGDTSDELLNESWSYVYTFVDEFGFEGPASDPTGLFTIGVGGSANLTFPPLPNQAGTSITKGYLYRTNAGDSGAAFQFVAEFTAAQMTASQGTPINDALSSADLQEVLSAEDNYPPPDETYQNGALRSLVELPGGVLAGHTPKAVHVTKPLQPHAWAYEYPCANEIVGIIEVPSGLLVLTVAGPYVLFGSTPEAMVLEKLPSEQGCLSQRSIIKVDNVVYFASKDGLCRYESGSVFVVTDPLMTRQQWQTYSPDSIHAFAHEGKYYSFNTATANFVYDPLGGQEAFTTLNLDFDIFAACREQNTDKTFIVADAGSGKSIYTFEGGTDQPYDWMSGEKQFPRPLALSYLKLYSDQDNARITVEIFADDVSVFRETILVNQLYRLPIQTKARIWQVRLTGTTTLEMLLLTNTRREIM